MAQVAGIKVEHTSTGRPQYDKNRFAKTCRFYSFARKKGSRNG